MQTGFYAFVFSYKSNNSIKHIHTYKYGILIFLAKVSFYTTRPGCFERVNFIKGLKLLRYTDDRLFRMEPLF